jgi:hypothetical protein
MGVFVGVDVGDGDAGGLKLADLRAGFEFDLCGTDAAREECGEEAAKGRAKTTAIRAEERRDGFGWRDGSAVDEEDVAADGWARAMVTASSKAGPEAISVAEVRAPAAASSAIARLMPRVRPKSSALRMRRAGIWFECRWKKDLTRICADETD